MMKITVNKNFLQEKKYTIDVLFNVFLGLQYDLIISDTIDSVQIKLENGHEFIIKDYFFSLIKDSNYLEESNLPKNPFHLKKSSFSNVELIGLYGENEVYEDSNKIICGLDIIASSFFMLTRWEEYVLKERDSHQRFSAKSSVAFQFNFLNRPIVNEYVEFIWDALVLLGINQQRKKRNFELIPTHDVDLPRLWWNSKDLIKSILGDILKRKDIKSALWSFKTYFSKKREAKDPFNTFDFLMSLSEKNNLKSHFFFMSGGTSNKDNFYKIDHPILKSLMEEIKSRGHHIGFHPSYNAYNDTKQFSKELNKLQENSPLEIKTGREHFLRFEVPYTWQVWEENNMEWDSSMSYADHEGFRCGVCYPFPVFNILERKKLNLFEKPLIVMDGSLVTYQDLTLEESYNKINDLIEVVKKYNGEFVFLWHNSAFNTLNWKPYQKIYERIINENTNHHRG